jgi:hypothetical protein
MAGCPWWERGGGCDEKDLLPSRQKEQAKVSENLFLPQRTDFRPSLYLADVAENKIN